MMHSGKHRAGFDKFSMLPFLVLAFMGRKAGQCFRSVPDITAYRTWERVKNSSSMLQMSFKEVYGNGDTTFRFRRRRQTHLPYEM